MEPIFSAVSNNANHLYTLLRCIGFASKASVQITPDGIRFSVEENRVMQGLAFLDKALFTTYTFNPPTTGQDANDVDDEEQDDIEHPQFLVSLSALLETLQIFGIGDTNLPSSSFSNPAPQGSAAGAFTNPALLLGRSCTLRYQNIGSPLSITLSESGITTTCELTTYESDDPSFGTAAGELDIPLQRDAIIMKIIMRSAWLHNAITELDGTDPTILSISASSKKEPFFALSGSGGPFSESTVEFSIDKNHHDNDFNHKSLTGDGEAPSRRAKLAPTVTETFQVNPPSSMGSRVKENYRFALIRKAARAMAAATKVSIRGDIQGVLGMQFMIELGDNGNVSGGNLPNEVVSRNVSFVDFRFVPLIDEDDGEEDDEMISF